MMKFVCDKSHLAEALTRISATVSRNAYTVPTDSEEEKKKAKNQSAKEVKSEISSKPNVISCDVNELAEYIGKGHCLCGMINKPQSEENTYTDKDGRKHLVSSKAFVKQTLYLLDFDNKTDPPRPEFQTADGVKEYINSTISERIKQTVNAVSIISESVSSTEQLRKWHVILTLETPIDDFDRARAIYAYIVGDIFKETADQSCKNPDRLAFGCTPEQITNAYDGYLTDSVIESIECLITQKEEKRKAEMEARAEAARIAPGKTEGSKLTADRLASIIISSPCCFETYDKWLSTAAALYHVAGIPSDTIAAWSATYDGTPQNPAQWENMNRNGTITIATLIMAAKLLNPTAFDSYIDEILKAKGLKPNHTSYFLEKHFESECDPAPADEIQSETPPAEDSSTEPPTPVIDNLEKADYSKGKEIYDYIGHFLDYTTGKIDEIGLTDYCGALEERAAELSCKTIYKNRMNAHIKALNEAAKSIEEEHTAARLNKLREELPEWVIPTPNGINKIDEIKFTDSFVKKYGEIKCINGRFYNIEGELTRSQIENRIQNQIKSYITQGVAFRTRTLCDCLAIECYSEPIQPEHNKIHVKNGTLTYTTTMKTDSDGKEYTVRGFEFSPDKEFCLCRMNVEYSDTVRRPDKWLEFLNDLLDPTDQQTLQEYIGYCLIPTTAAQKSLFIIGQGGEGKSVIGVIMNEIFGTGMTTGSVNKLDNGSGSRFALTSLVNRLVMLDDDINLSALENTATFKQIVTARIPLEVEQKGLPSYQVLLYSRIIAFGNGALSSLYDNSDGFWRRQIILSALPKAPDRVDNPNIIADLLEEKDLIFNWALRGLERLMKNNFNFTISEQTRQNIEDQKRESNSIIPFMESGTVTIGKDYCIHSNDLYNIYSKWCEENVLYAKTANTFVKYLKENSNKYGIKFDYNVTIKGRRGRGFKGLGYISPVPLNT